ncbi:MAG: undecaprenyl-phosphate glucose phosphotransferase [Dysgonamonadaceae bacterium]|jgi:putative colanic acid biosynthesis UDP-glucose lipid carrier transferase|nr:undecaprenyl-phosphate glucose phosphotransferase [Dysgonamonadaceae bacterium]
MKQARGYGFLIKWLVVFGDLFVLNSMFILAYFWTKTDGLPDFAGKLKIVILLLNFCYLFSLYFVPVKIDVPVLYTDKVVQRSLSLMAFHAIIYIACLAFLDIDSNDFPTKFLVVYYIILFVLFSLWRIFAREALKRYRRIGRNFKRVVIIGAGKNGMDLYAELKKEMAYGYQVLGFFDDNLLLKHTLPNYLGMTHEIEEYVLENSVDEIYCTLPNSQDEKIVRLLNFSEKNMVRFYIVPEFYRYLKKKMTLENIESLPVMMVRSEPLQYVHNRMIKRTFDIFFSLTFLLTVFPVCYLVFGMLIKLSSRGPIFFKQLRTGIYGKDFYCYKFRSMKMNVDADEKQAEKDDPRTTWIGEFLRRTNLDETPQFYNALKGDMSIVGPRPHMLKHTELYSMLIDKYMVRHLIKPGITGWAQVNGYRGETKMVEQMEQRVRMDVWYLENWTFLLDLKIVVVTIFNMFKGEKNAY